MRYVIGFLAASLLCTGSALAQRGGGGGRGHEAPPKAEPTRRPDEAPRAAVVVRHTPAHVRGSIWMGGEHPRNDPRFHLAHPWEHGRFKGRLGVGQVWHLRGGTRARFFVGAGYFGVAPWEFTRVDNWWWDRDDILIFVDPDADGWYVAYNTRLDVSVHVLFLG